MLVSKRSVCGVFRFALCIFMAPGIIQAEETGTRLDVETLVAANDVTTPESLAADPWGRLLEARFRVSLLNSPASGREIVEFVTRLESPSRTAQVVDYLPRTTMSSDVAGSMQAQRRDHSSRWLDFQLQGFAPWLAAGPARGSIRGAGLGCAHRKILTGLVRTWVGERQFADVRGAGGETNQYGTGAGDFRTPMVIGLPAWRARRGGLSLRWRSHPVHQ